MNAAARPCWGGKLTLTGVSANRSFSPTARCGGGPFADHDLWRSGRRATPAPSFTKEPPNATVSAFSKDGRASAMRRGVEDGETGGRPADLRCAMSSRAISTGGGRAGFALHRSLRIRRLSRRRVRGWRLTAAFGGFARGGSLSVGAVGVGRVGLCRPRRLVSAASAQSASARSPRRSCDRRSGGECVSPYGYPYAYPAARLRPLPVSALLLSAVIREKTMKGGRSCSARPPPPQV